MHGKVKELTSARNCICTRLQWHIWTNEGEGPYDPATKTFLDQCKSVREVASKPFWDGGLRKMGEDEAKLGKMGRHSCPKRVQKSVRARQFRDIGVLDRWKHTLED